MKKIISVITSISLLICAFASAQIFPVQALHSNSRGDIVYYGDFAVGDGVLWNYKGSDTNVVIPSNLGITAIGDSAFIDNYDIVSVTIPDGVTSIGDDAFYYCESLTYVTFGTSLKTIGDSAFFYTGLTNIKIPDSVTKIDNSAFDNCIYLTSVTIGKSVTTIGSCAFIGCDSLPSISIPNSVTTIGECAFGYCSGLTEVSIPSSVTSAGDGIFEECYGLTAINVDVNNLYYSSENGIFFNKNKTELIQYPINKNSTSYIVPNSVTIIDYGAFSENTYLTSVTIGKNVKTIDNWAFFVCEGLKTISIPSSVTSLGDYSFADCTTLSSAYFYGNAPSTGECVFDDTAYNFKVYYISGKTGFTTPTWNGYPTATFIPAPSAPDAPTGLISTGKTDTSVDLSWSASTGATGYNVYKGSVKLNSTPVTDSKYTVTGLTQNMNYAFTVTAVNANGESGSSAQLNVKTAINCGNYINPYTINSNLLSGLSAASNSYSQFTASFHPDSNTVINVYDKDGVEMTSGLIGTGCTVKITVNNVLQGQYEVVLYGDMNEDGLINASDLLVLKKHMLNIKKITGISLNAANASRDTSGSVDASDLLSLKLQLLRMSSIKQD